MFNQLSNDQIKKILIEKGLNYFGEIIKSNVGFSNDVYFVGNHVLKVGKSEEDRNFLRREAFFYGLFANKLPVPKVIVKDFSSNPPYFIYKKIVGTNLYTHWHQYTNQQRRNAVRCICEYLCLINLEDPRPYCEKFGVDPNRDWQNYVLAKLEKWKQQAVKQDLISNSQVGRINELVEVHKDSLKESKMALTYYDPHFDNILVKNGEVTGILDLERTDYLSIDFVLDLAKRMVDYPTKYVSEESKNLIKKEDYNQLLKWYKEFYPQLFEFDQLEKRLKLYGVRYTLKILTMFPRSKQAKSELVEVLR
ncbi:MAG: aminoglycoside phosphotransferase family protein [Patescibacteria group bacterium]|nr:aminoglycoside phosphotransferase family protein [Patescibacteria group bacterium]